MFEEGRSYSFVTDTADGEIHFSATVLSVELPLIKLERTGNYEIINVHSKTFVSAKPDDAAAKDSELAALSELQVNITRRFVGLGDVDL